MIGDVTEGSIVKAESGLKTINVPGAKLDPQLPIINI